jgi:putative ABC transport system permease protein
MSKPRAILTRFLNLFSSRGQHDRDLNAELHAHLQLHIDDNLANGMSPGAARRDALLHLGGLEQTKERIRDQRLIPWLDSLRSDLIFGYRQLTKDKVTSLAAILSLALAIGACTSAFRLIDALLLRPLPIAGADRLYVLAEQGIDPGGRFRISDACEYPLFRQLRATVKNQAELIAVSFGVRDDLTYGSDAEMERAHLNFVSGWMFSAFGLRPALGRLFTEADDQTPGAHPYAVLSNDYWTHRFGQDPQVMGRTFRMGHQVYQIVGVAQEGFTGTEPGTVTDIFLPTMMNAGVTHSDWSWFRAFVQLKPGVAPEPLLDRLRVPFQTTQEERAKGFVGTMLKSGIENFLHQKLLLQPASAGVSGMQTNNRAALTALAALVALVLLIACANVANLMSARAAARAREMALRVSIGAGRSRLVQLVLIESAMLASVAAALGGLFAWWSAPFIVSRINPPDDPARLHLPADWRVFGFGLILTLIVACLFGLPAALRASSTAPASGLRGGDDPHARRRWMHALVATQVAFCFLVLFLTGLFVASFQRLSNQPTGYSSERLLALTTVAQTDQPAVNWDQVAEHLRRIPGVESVALSGWPLLDGNGWSGFICVNGGAPSPDLAYFLGVSPGWIDTMKIPWLDGRDFELRDTYPGTAVVNEAFAKRFFPGEDPIGKWFEKTEGSGQRPRMQIIGVVGDARYRNMREPITPTAYVPFRIADSGGTPQAEHFQTFIIRVAGSSPLALASTLRQEVSRARPEFYVSNIRTQTEINQAHTVRERLLATLASFFSVVALLLAAVGLYGVLHYSVLQRRREIAIRMAVGAQARGIVRLVTLPIISMILLGGVAGLILGLLSVRYIQELFYHVRPTDLPMLGLPGVTLLAAACSASIPAVLYAVHTDPATVLRSE